MGIDSKGQVCVMIHSGSRGFGHQVATGNYIIHAYLNFWNLWQNSVLLNHSIHFPPLTVNNFFFLDALVAMEKAMKRDNIEVNDRQLACAHINSEEGQNYLKSMAAAGNFAWVNRSSMTFLSRQVINLDAIEISYYA